MGADCSGRGTYGGGGFDCDVALKVVRRAGVSAALFAPGYVLEEVRRREGKTETAGASVEDNEDVERQDCAEAATAALHLPPPAPPSSSHHRTFLRVERAF